MLNFSRRRFASAACLAALAGSIGGASKVADAQPTWNTVVTSDDSIEFDPTCTANCTMFDFDVALSRPVIAQNDDILFSESRVALVAGTIICEWSTSLPAPAHRRTVAYQDNNSLSNQYDFTNLKINYYAFSSPSTVPGLSTVVFHGNQTAGNGVYQSVRSTVGSPRSNTSVAVIGQVPSGSTHSFNLFDNWMVNPGGTIVSPTYMFGADLGLFQFVGTSATTVVNGDTEFLVPQLIPAQSNPYGLSGVNAAGAILSKQTNGTGCPADYSVQVNNPTLGGADDFAVTEGTVLPWDDPNDTRTRTLYSTASTHALDINSNGDFVFSATARVATSTPCDSNEEVSGDGIWYAKKVGSTPAAYEFYLVARTGLSVNASCSSTTAFVRVADEPPLLLLSGRGGSNTELVPEARVVFYARINGSPSLARGIWTWTPSQGLSLVARDGFAAPGGGTLSLTPVPGGGFPPDTIAINSKHDIVFLANVVEAQNPCIDELGPLARHQALFAWTPQTSVGGGLRVLTKSGSSDSGGIITSIDFVGGSGGQDGRPSGLNESRRIAVVLHSKDCDTHDLFTRVVWAAIPNEQGIAHDPCVCCSCEAECDSIDFNNDGLFPDTLDIDDFLSVFSGGPCSNDPFCNDIDFNNDCLFPDTLDIDALLSVFSGGPCL